MAIPLWVFGITCGLEFANYGTPSFRTVSFHLLGRIPIGTTFSCGIFPHYVLGCLWVGSGYSKLRKNF